MLVMLAAMAVGIVAAVPCVGSFVYAQPADGGLKDVYANYFRIGTCYQWRNNGLTDATYRNTVLREFNSVTHEDDLKPYATMVQAGSTDNNIQVTLNAGARQIMAFCTTNNIGLRGHALVWHQQTPNWFFWANMQSGNSSARASVATMNQRMESYIKNLLELIKRDFPSLNLYAYDVVNEIFRDNGTAREAGGLGNNATEQNGTDQSPWVQIYGNNSFADSAFVYARRHGATTFPNMKLFYNDFNEYHPDGKREAMYTMAMRLGPAGRNVMDGIGMQSHLSTSWPDMATYKSALTRFIATGLEIHVTELDITIESGSNETRQAEIYAEVFKALKEAREDGANITSVSVWGVTDDRSWRADRNPLLFNNSFAKKPAYNSVAALVPEAHWGDGKNPTLTPPDPDAVVPDANGFFFYHDFENNTTQGWVRRGDVTVENTTAQKNSGSRALFVNGRTQNWNGAILPLNDRAFKSGTEYSFSVMAMSQTAGTMSLSLQYNDVSGTESYDNIGSAVATAGQWVQISNTSYQLPAGTNFSIYVEMDAANASFYFDDAMGGVKGATINPDGTPGDITASVQAGRNAACASAAQLVTVRGRTLNVNAHSDSKVKIRVVNLTGKTIANFAARGGANVSLRKIPAGVYIVETRIDGRKTTTPVVLR